MRPNADAALTQLEFNLSKLEFAVAWKFAKSTAHEKMDVPSTSRAAAGIDWLPTLH